MKIDPRFEAECELDDLIEALDNEAPYLSADMKEQIAIRIAGLEEYLANAKPLADAKIELCVCGRALKDCPDSYAHMSSGF